MICYPADLCFRCFSTPEGIINGATPENLAIYKQNFLYPYLTNPPVYGNGLLEILAHFKPNNKGLIDATELKPFLRALNDLQDCGNVPSVSNVYHTALQTSKSELHDL